MRSCWGSIRLAIVVGRRSWREILSRRGPDFHKKEKEAKRKNMRKGKPVETAAAVEIDKGGLRRLFLGDFHRCLKKACAKTAPAFFTVPTGPTTTKLTIGDWNTKDALLRRATQPKKPHLHKIPDTAQDPSFPQRCLKTFTIYKETARHLRFPERSLKIYTDVRRCR